MKYLGLLTINAEDDILERTLEHNAQFVDAFYVLDGTAPTGVSETICLANPKCAGYTCDWDLPAEYGTQPRDGWRQHLYQQAITDHGFDNWFLLLHGDEVWTQDPREHVGVASGYIYRLPFYFPRAGETWDYMWHPIDQLQWRLGPGWPEFRMFRGSPEVGYDPLQHFNVTPDGIRSFANVAAPILHYPYRSPHAQRGRAKQTWDPDNYRHVIEGDEVYWTDERINYCLARPEGHFRVCERETSFVGV